MHPALYQQDNMKSKLIIEAQKIIESYDSQGWKPFCFQFNKVENIGVCRLKHKNGNNMEIYINYLYEEIVVKVNDKLKDRLKIG